MSTALLANHMFQNKGLALYDLVWNIRLWSTNSVDRIENPFTN